MKSVFLSPSTQEHNVGPCGYIESAEMNKVADVAEKILTIDYGIKVYRNDPKGGVGDSVRKGNSLHPDLYIAIHSNAGGAHGCEVYHNASGLPLAKLIYDGISKLTPNLDRGIKGDGGLYETRNAQCPAILVETEFHDNAKGAEFIKTHIDVLGGIIADSAAKVLKVSKIVIKFKSFGINTVGGRVYDVQRGLNKHGAKLTVDGQFGALTKSAVIAFQKFNKLKADGVVDIKTWTELSV